MIIANNGWVLIDTLRYIVDAFLIEGLFTEYDFETGNYRIKGEDEYIGKVNILRKLGRRIFTLDFLPEGDRRRDDIVRLSMRFGFIPYISTVELNKIHR
jgi:hypothetical protein